MREGIEFAMHLRAHKMATTTKICPQEKSIFSGYFFLFQNKSGMCIDLKQQLWMNNRSRLSLGVKYVRQSFCP